MALIKQITISGFRGILSPLSLDFVKGKTPRSMIIYGRNGTGKSSITDAWEWFHSERIGHLAREGAGPSSYPHRNAKHDETYVEVQFEDDELGKVCLNFDHSRVTMPIADGDIAKFRALAPHPCHIRFEDLTRFVYLTKTEKYDALAQLMGFTPQVEFQKALRRVLRQLSDELATRKQNADRIKSQMSSRLELDRIDEASVLDSSNAILRRHGIETVDSVQDLETAIKAITELVENDPRSQELADLGTLTKALERLKLPDDLETKLQSYVRMAQAFRLKEKAAVDLLLIGLYEQGESVLKARESAGQDIRFCPLCGRPYEGDLLGHISSELASLKELKKARDNLDKKRKQTLEYVGPLCSLSERVQHDCQGIESVAAEWSVDPLVADTKEMEKLLEKFRASLNISPEDLQTRTIESMQETTKALASKVPPIRADWADLRKRVTKRVRSLQQDTSRAQLVTDHTKMVEAVKLWAELGIARRKLSRLNKTYKRFEDIVEDYVKSSIENVEQRFNAISSDMQRYFEILEEHTEGLGHPEMKLLRDQDRAVVLQVEFHGELISPAYRYLSESQLNSFGLAVFLASAKHFNPRFKFLILDDVINSFDGYKRPLVIKLLKQQFSDHQVLLLTHDMVWCNRLYEECPTWVKHKFVRYEPGSGPVIHEAVSPLAKIERLLDEDEPVNAGGLMAPFLERQLQELCESFGVMVKYNQRNEYSLAPLLDRFRVRIGEKLGKDHPLYEAVKALQSESGFRNICVHWKDPAIPITLPEMRTVVSCWKAIEALVRCKEENCCGFLRYDGKRDFVCECGATRLSKN